MDTNTKNVKQNVHVPVHVVGTNGGYLVPLRRQKRNRTLQLSPAGTQADDRRRGMRANAILLQHNTSSAEQILSGAGYLVENIIFSSERHEKEIVQRARDEREQFEPQLRRHKVNDALSFFLPGFHPPTKSRTSELMLHKPL